MIRTRIRTGLIIAMFVFCFFGNADAFSISATLTADNDFALYVGNENGVSFIGSGHNWKQPQTFTFDADSEDYLYVAAWSDGAVAQGLIGEFVSDSDVLVTNTSDWEVYLTNHDLDSGYPSPLPNDIETDISMAEWQPIADSLDHGSSPWGSSCLAEISEDAQWIWGSHLRGGSDYGEYQLFRTPVDSSQTPEPATIFLLSSGLMGLMGFGKRFRKK